MKRKCRSRKKRAKSSEKFKSKSKKINWTVVKDVSNSKFKGYESTFLSADIVKYSSYKNEHYVVLNQTPFYAESGGQVADTGSILGDEINLKVQNVQFEGEMIIHKCTGEINGKNFSVKCQVDESRRQMIRKNHTATHLMHKALKVVLGDHVQQAGSLVHPNYLRFDITHFEKIASDEIKEIEQIVNNEILSNNKLDIAIQSFDEAKKEGALAMFGEKYGDSCLLYTSPSPRD